MANARKVSAARARENVRALSHSCQAGKTCRVILVDPGPSWHDLRKSYLRGQSLNSRVTSFWEEQQKAENEWLAKRGQKE